MPAGTDRKIVLSQHLLDFKVVGDGFHISEQSNCVLFLVNMLVIRFFFNPYAYCVTALTPDNPVQFRLVLVVDVFTIYVLVNLFLPNVLIEIATIFS